VRHLEPGTIVPLPDRANAVRVYVLGPPVDTRLFGLTDSASQTYHFGLDTALRNGLALADGRLSIHDDPLAPFDGGIGRQLSKVLADQGPLDQPDVAFLSAHYAGPAPVKPQKRAIAPQPDQAWRRIDSAWLGAASDLALQLDSRTNNTSLVLAIEIVATGRVLIFAADAQIGNWSSWKDVTFPAQGTAPAVTGADLLARTVFYKVGHHGSRNATLSDGGLELMTSTDLTAFIPTDEVMAKKVRWNDIPANGLLSRLREKTGGRVIQSDRDWIQKPGVAAEVTAPSGSLRSLAVETGLRVDLEVG